MHKPHLATASAVFDKFLTETEEKKFFAAIKAASGWLAVRDFHFFQLLRHGGLRIGTAVRLTVADAQQALTGGELVLRDAICKGGAGYSVPVHKRLEAALRGLLQIRREQMAGLDPEAPLLISRETLRTDEVVSERAMQMRAAHWTARAQLGRRATPHVFRHTLGQRVMRRSTAADPLRVTAGALGHRSLSSTMVYTRPTREDLAQAMAEAVS